MVIKSGSRTSRGAGTRASRALSSVSFSERAAGWWWTTLFARGRSPSCRLGEHGGARVHGLGIGP
eukprot:10452340-Alexandrium_andersonii.AAC.1